MPTNTNNSFVDFHEALSNSLPKLLKCTAGVFFTFVILFECLIIIIALLRSKKFLTRQTQQYLLNVALIDLFSGVFIVPPLTVIEISGDLWTYSSKLCIYWLTIGSLLLNARVLALFIVSFDRYLSVCHAMRYSHILTYSRARLSIIFSWVLALLLILPQLAVFTAEPTAVSQNSTDIYLPLDWTHSTSKPLRGLLVLMFLLRIAAPIIGALVMTILALRIVIASSRGFQDGFLKVKDPNLPLNVPVETSKAQLTQQRPHAQTLPRKTVTMRIHRGNYMTDGTKDLFAQLPLTTRAQSARLSRRTAVLPNLGYDGARFEGRPLKRAHTVYQNRPATSNTASLEAERKNSNFLTTEKSTHSTSILSSSPESPEGRPLKKTNDNEHIQQETQTLETQSDEPVGWWQSARSRLAAHTFSFNSKRLQDMGAMIPLSFLLLAFLLFSLPYQLLQVVQAIWANIALPHDINTHLYWLACANSLINPVILTFWSPSCRSKVLHIVSCGRFHPKEVAIKRLIIASFGTANLPYGRHVRPRSVSD